MSQTFHIKALENLWQAARLVVPGLPEIEALDMDSADLGALSGLGIAPYWLLSFVLVGTCTAIVLSIFLPQGLLLLCIPRIVTVALLFVVLKRTSTAYWAAARRTSSWKENLFGNILAPAALNKVFKVFKACTSSTAGKSETIKKPKRGGFEKCVGIHRRIEADQTLWVRRGMEH
ncbi:hypothetical protein CGGC5_v017075 [Colletotrichum fructicola Nara gc5]|uniref:Uncharacterized protein n=1 Tax=Colletotrichum fructicola (strain Nara gc5) TaxID=1213859 RepID=A0A7J6ICW9_COLFN|nr:hypothetical protein CGGC5_v017075 [Colletotrichum fructicola Nara gc5]